MREDAIKKLMMSAKYRDVCPDTIRRIYADCEKKYKRPKDVEHATRERLHGVTGAYLTENDNRRALALAEAGEWEQLLSLHASTRERLPIEETDALYERIFGICGVPDTLLDLACGLNPVYLAARYPDMHITAADMSGQCLRIIRACCAAGTICCDLICEGGVPQGRYDMVLLFKILPLIERERTGTALRVLQQCDTRYLVVSYPTRTLGGRNVGMAQHYDEWMQVHVPDNRLIEAQFETANELFYVLKEK